MMFSEQKNAGENKRRRLKKGKYKSGQDKGEQYPRTKAHGSKPKHFPKIYSTHRI